MQHALITAHSSSERANSGTWRCKASQKTPFNVWSL